MERAERIRNYWDNLHDGHGHTIIGTQVYCGRPPQPLAPVPIIHAKPPARCWCNNRPHSAFETYAHSAIDHQQEVESTPRVTPYDFQIERLTQAETSDKGLTPVEAGQLTRLENLRVGWLSRGLSGGNGDWKDQLAGRWSRKQATIDELRQDLEKANNKLAGLIQTMSGGGGIPDRIRQCTGGAGADLLTLASVLGSLTILGKFDLVKSGLEAVARLDGHISIVDEQTGRLEQAVIAARLDG